MQLDRELEKSRSFRRSRTQEITDYLFSKFKLETMRAKFLVIINPVYIFSADGLTIYIQLDFRGYSTDADKEKEDADISDDRVVQRTELRK